MSALSTIFVRSRVARAAPSSTAVTRPARVSTSTVAWPVPGPISRTRACGR